MSDPHVFGELDAHLMREGKHPRLFEKLGAHPARGGTRFAVWAPHADSVSVIGDWNEWKPDATPLAPIGDTGVWQGIAPGVGHGARYKYEIAKGAYRVAKADPFALRHQLAPETASIVWQRAFTWSDARWLRARQGFDARSSALAIYEVHLGSWRRVVEEGNRSLGYREITAPLVDHVRSLDLAAIRAPTLLLYAPDDQVVDAEEATRVLAALGGHGPSAYVVEGSGDPAAHVVAGSIMSPGTTDAVRDRIVRFLHDAGVMDPR